MADGSPAAPAYRAFGSVPRTDPNDRHRTGPVSGRYCRGPIPSNTQFGRHPAPEHPVPTGSTRTLSSRPRDTSPRWPEWSRILRDATTVRRSMAAVDGGRGWRLCRPPVLRAREPVPNRAVNATPDIRLPPQIGARNPAPLPGGKAGPVSGSARTLLIHSHLYLHRYRIRDGTYRNSPARGVTETGCVTLMPQRRTFRRHP